MNKVGVFLGVEPYTGGISQYAKTLLEALRPKVEQGCEVVVAFISGEWDSVLLDYPFTPVKLEHGNLGIKMANGLMALRLSGFLTRMFARIFNPLARQLEQQGCDLWIFPCQDCLTWQIKGPVVGTVHDLMHRYEPHFQEVSKNGRFAIREHRFRSITDHSIAILADSQMGVNQVVESYGTDLKKLYSLPFVPPAHSLIDKVPADFDDRYSLPEKFIFYPAQYWEHKNHKRLINAAAEVRKTYPDIHLVFTGAKLYSYKSILAHAKAQGMMDSLTFTSHIPDEDLVGFYRKARAMMMPTFFGPTNIPPLEAMANGCPVGVSRIYGMPEQLGDAALFFDPKSEQEIAEVMIRLWHDDDLCRQLRDKGYEKNGRWGQKQFADRFCDILTQIEQRI